MNRAVMSKLLTALALIGLFALQWPATPIEAQDPQPSQYKPRKPTPVDLAPESADSQERVLRQEKSRRYNRPGAQKLTELLPGVEPLPLIGHHRPTEPVPVGDSDMVIVGEVEQLQPYLSSDKSSLYTEFRVRIGEVLKNDLEIPLLAGNVVLLEREGGVLRLPDGRIIVDSVQKRSLPVQGGRYVFFAKKRGSPGGLYIYFAYEFVGDQVFSLDEVKSSSSTSSLHFSADKEGFLTDLREKARVRGQRNETLPCFSWYCPVCISDPRSA